MLLWVTALTEPLGWAKSCSKGFTPLSSFNPPNNPKSWELLLSPICTEASTSLAVKSMHDLWTWQT